MQDSNNQTIVITQERMAGWLMFNRFHKVNEKTDLKNSTRNIYIFKDTKELRDTMVIYNQYKEMLLDANLNCVHKHKNPTEKEILAYTE